MSKTRPKRLSRRKDKLSQISPQDSAGNKASRAPNDRSRLGHSRDKATRRDTLPVNHRQQRLRRWSLIASDSLGLLLAIAVTYAIDRLTGVNLVWSPLVIPVWIFVAKIYNLYDRDDRRIRHSTIDEIPELIATGAITAVVAKGITEIFPVPHFPSRSMIMIAVLGVMFVFLLRGLTRQLYRTFGTSERTVVVGSGQKAQRVSQRLLTHVNGNIEVVGYLTPSGHIGNPASPDDLPTFGSIDLLQDVARRHEIVRVVIADDDFTTREIGDIVDRCHETKISVTLVPANQEILGPDTELNRVGEVPMLDFHVSVPPRSTLAIKRALDITASGGLLLLASPVLLVSMLLIVLDSRGPVFFRQVRIGKDGKPFKMIKLRTMVSNAEEMLDDLIDLDALEDPAFKIPDDPRVTRVGRYLRRSSLDEVPQFINVLRGDMSLVGPRPEEEAVVALYDERQRQRLAVKPGLTGPMQIAGRGRLSFDERLALERDYLDNMTIPRDISILLQTPRAVIKGDGAF